LLALGYFASRVLYLEAWGRIWLKHVKECFAIKPDAVLNLHYFPQEMVQQRLADTLQAGNEEIDQVLSYLLQRPGKMLRPRLVYLCASFYPHDATLLCDTAVAIELIHLASLVHDDIIDGSQLRRGQDSLNTRWGEKISVLTGDYLFASAYDLLSQSGRPDILQKVSFTIKTMCGGEIRQLNQAGRFSLSQDEYFEKCFAKTACLFGCACRAGALTSEMPDDEIFALEQFGLCAGYAYQIIDDVLDFVGESRELGKPVGGDLLEGNVTLPVLLAREDPDHGPRINNLLRGELSKADIPRIIRVLEESQALELSMRWAAAFLQQGREFLNKLPECPARQDLNDFSLYLIDAYYRANRMQTTGNAEV
jgi:heptaprenyl diphosphate synthase